MKILKKVLGDTYGGPSISVMPDGSFVLYRWHNAPVSEEILVQSYTWQDFLYKLKQYYKNNKSNV